MWVQSLWWNNNTRELQLFALACAVGALGTFFALLALNNIGVTTVAEKAADCAHLEFQNKKIECWYGVVRGEYARDGLSSALDAFSYLYSAYPAFADSGCHRHAHAVGDMAFYFDYLTHRDLTKMDFPVSANACGYGFYHGFFEHLIQETPEPAFVTETCEYFDRTMASTSPAIRQVCYHGSGHGFTLALADTLRDPSQWTIAGFAVPANTECDALPQSSEFERSECRQGVYNLLIDWMSDGAYGLSLDRNVPFAFCDRERPEWQADCYYEVAQKLDGLSGYDPIRAMNIVSKFSREDLKRLVLITGIAGMVQHDPQGTQHALVASCRVGVHSLREACFTGIVAGMVEHGAPGKEYERADVFCSSAILTEDERTDCFASLTTQLERYHSPQSVATLCATNALSKNFCTRVAL